MRSGDAGFAKASRALYTLPMRRLGIDLGTVRTGLAVAETGLNVATPLCTLAHTGFAQALTAVCEHIERQPVDEIVLGLPLELAGREGDAARRVRRFAKELATRTQLRVCLWDERLSTAAAERSLRGQGVRGAARRSVIDQVAATLLLQSYLDAHGRGAQVVRAASAHAPTARDPNPTPGDTESR